MTINNVKAHYIASINDVPCVHHHKTYEAAQTCALKTVRAAKHGKIFYGSDWAKKINLDKDCELSICVKRRLIAY